MLFVPSFLVVPWFACAIVSEPITVPYIQTIERINAVSARAIAGHTENGKTPRVEGMRDYWLSVLFELIKYNSGIIGK